MDIDTFSLNIIKLCQKPNSALAAIHQIMQINHISQNALMAVYHRVLIDKDSDGAYYLVALAQKNSDLPFDVPKLIELVMNHATQDKKLQLLKQLPKIVQNELKQTYLI